MLDALKDAGQCFPKDDFSWTQSSELKGSVLRSSSVDRDAMRADLRLDRCTGIVEDDLAGLLERHVATNAITLITVSGEARPGAGLRLVAAQAALVERGGIPLHPVHVMAGAAGHRGRLEAATALQKLYLASVDVQVLIIRLGAEGEIVSDVVAGLVGESRPQGDAGSGVAERAEAHLS